MIFSRIKGLANVNKAKVIFYESDKYIFHGESGRRIRSMLGRRLSGFTMSKDLKM